MQVCFGNYIVYLIYLKKALTHNGTIDWTKGVVRPSLQNIWPLFLSIHLLLGISGAASSICMCRDMFYTRLHKNSTGVHLINLLVINSLMLCIVLPLNFLVMLYENWIFGMLMCYFVSIAPYILVHSAMFNFILMAIDRYRAIAHPNKRQLNTVASLVTIWVFSVCAAMPVITYIHYRDIGHIDIRLKNNGFCWSTGDDYGRIVFITIFTIPVVLIVFILMKTAAELKMKQEICKANKNLRQRPCSFNAENSEIFLEDDDDSIDGDIYDQRAIKNKIWIKKEKTTQKYLTTMTALWVSCWVPIKIFSDVSSNTAETEENAALFDIAHMILLPMAAVSTITTPVCFIMMHRAIKNEPFLLARKSCSNNYELSTTNASQSMIYQADSLHNNDEQFFVSKFRYA